MGKRTAHNMKLPGAGYSAPLAVEQPKTRNSVVPFAVLRDATGAEIAWVFGKTWDGAKTNAAALARELRERHTVAA